MTPDPLTDGLVADHLRSTVDAMREAVRRTAARGADCWGGPFPELAAALGRLARVDLCLARLVEGHADSLRIHAQAGSVPRDGVYGVWASRSAGTGVRAVPEEQGWHLEGECRFASGIDLLDRALVPGWLADGTHLLFDIAAGEVKADRSTWHTTAMDASRSFTVTLDLHVSGADVVGPPGFYLDRPGFAVGGLGVAAVWAGGAQAVLELVVAGLRRFGPTPHQLRRVGVMEQAVEEAWAAVETTSRRLPDLSGERLVADTARARTSVVTACERVVDEGVRVVGPGGLSASGRLARTLGDLTIYVRQHHLDPTLEALGRDALRTREVLG